LALKIVFLFFGVVLEGIYMGALSRLFFTLAVAIGAVQAAEIPNYIGEQSFRLSDDADLMNAQRRADSAKVEVANSEMALGQIAQQVKSLEDQQRSIQTRMDALSKDIESAKANKAVLAAKLVELQKTPDVNAAAITQTQADIAALDTQIVEKSKQAGALKLESAPVNVRLDQVRNDFNNASRKVADNRQRQQEAQQSLQQYRNDLIAALSKINNDGSRNGQIDGAGDGASLSAKLASDRGTAEGQTDGYNQGTTDGQSRYYQQGAVVGDREGATRASNDGLRDGTNEGTVAGNKNAANREGSAAGVARANSSNAASVGTEQGKAAGFSRAVETGKVDGRDIGEKETTTKMESGALSSSSLNGSFAGSFQRRAPAYPGDFNGQTYRPNVNAPKDILRKAYADGYTFSYRQYTRYEFQRRIDADYNAVYDRNYTSSYNNAVNREYPAYYEQGRRDADASAYQRQYPIAKASAYKAAFERQNANPDRGSAEYKSTYSVSELASYNAQYEAIRRTYYDAKEQETFAANIAAQTEIYRQKRIAEVSAIYNNNAVLEFVSSDMLDGGIKGVALLDGVFQPGETTNHNVVLRNYGFKAAGNVTVQLDNGQAVQLPSIPARSLVTVKGAAQSVVSVPLNGTHRSSLKVVSPLATTDAVESRHYEQANGGVLKLADQKSVKVSYPIALSGLSLESQLLKGTKNKLKITLTNNSKRAYTGELKIKLLANSQNSIFTKDFSPVSSLQSTATVSDAEILVDSEEDAYRDLSISATLEQDGVQVGALPQDFVTMAKAQFFDKGKVPVLIANTDLQLDAFQDALAALGGSDKVSVLDLSLATLNSATLANGLSQKTLLVVDDANGTSVKTLNAFIGKSKSSAFVFIDDSNSGLKNVLALGSLKDAPKLNLGSRQIAFSNPHRAAGVTKASAFFQSSLSTFTNDLALAQRFTITAPEMIAEIKAKVSTENYGKPNDTLKVLSLQVLSEVLSINKAYDESGNIFTRDKKWAKMIAEDSSLFHNQIKAAASGDVVVSKLPLILAAAAMKDTVSNAMKYDPVIYKAMMTKIMGAENDVLDSMEDSYKKSLKKDFKELYTRVYDKEEAKLHRPFAIDDTEPDRN
jgi:predicted  nucleic acid-binding Zn-ribbon protein